MKVQISNHSNGPVSFPQPILTTLPQGKSKVFVMNEQGYAALMSALAVQRLRRSNLISISVIPDEAPVEVSVIPDEVKADAVPSHDTGANFPLGPDGDTEDANAMESLAAATTVPIPEQIEAVMAAHNVGVEEKVFEASEVYVYMAPADPAPLRGTSDDLVAFDEVQDFPASEPVASEPAADDNKKKRGRKKKS